jgi:hypothetical protein
MAVELSRGEEEDAKKLAGDVTTQLERQYAEKAAS